MNKILAAAAFCAVAAGAVAPAAADDYGYRRTVQLTVPAGGAKSLTFRGYNGDATFTADSGSTVRISAVLRARSESGLDGVKVFAQRAGDDVNVAEGCASRRTILWIWTIADCEVDYVVLYPRDLTLNLRSDNGDIHVDGAQGSATVVDSNGDVILRGAANSLDLSTKHGDVDATLANNWHGAAIAMHTSTGDIRLGVPAGFKATLDAHKMLGDLNDNAHLTGGPVKVTAGTTFGDIDINRL